LLISQFTLYGNCQKGRKLDFHETMAGAEAKSMFERFVEIMREEFGV
jgi:D-tyrosyl-tRNA(Tyr) deacylase